MICLKNSMANNLCLCVFVLCIFVCPQPVLCKIQPGSSSSSLSSPNDQKYSKINATSTTQQFNDVDVLPEVFDCNLENLYFNHNFTNTTRYLSFVANKTCNFAVSLDTRQRIVINTDRFEPNNTFLPYVYVDLKEATAVDLNSCPKRIFSLPLDRTSYCGIELIGLDFTVYVQADVTLRLQIYETTEEFQLEEEKCPRFVGLNTECENKSCTLADDKCQPMQVYDDVVMCEAKIVLDPDNLPETVIKCDTTCPLSCQCQLGVHKITQVCYENETRDILLLFPSSEVLKLDLRNLNLSSIRINSFHEFKGLTQLDLSHNLINNLQPGVFNGLENIQKLFLTDNHLTKLNSGVLRDMKQLSELYLAENNLRHIDDYAFEGLSNLFYLDMKANNLSTIKSPLFDDLISMFILDIKNNHLTELGPNVFHHTKGIILLDLSLNNLKEIEPGTFQGLSALGFLYLSYNQLETVECGTFSGLNKITTLTLSHNRIGQIHQHTFFGLSELKFLLLDNNLLRNLESTAFEELTSLRSLDIRMNSLDQVNIHAFDGISNQTKILVDNHSVCCFIKEADCIATYPKQVFLTCGQLLPYNVLRVVLSILGSLALIGNAMVLYWRCRIRRRDNKVQFLLIVNLSASDFLMGIYMMILVSGDVHFGERFPLEADAWRRSRACKLAGFLAVLSSEASAFFVTLISIDRLLGVKYPFSSHRLGNKSAKLAITGVWFLAVTLSVVLTLLARIDPDMYALSEVCIGLPLARRWVNNPHNITVALGNGDETVEISQTTRTDLPGMYLSIAVFLGLNLLCFLIIAYCYVVIFITAQKTSRRASRRREKEEEIRMAAKMSVIVVTDFLCWMPIIFIGILVQSGAFDIPPVVYAWIVTFVLPINSSANPFLYTIATIIADRVGKRPRGASVDSQCGRKFNGTHYYLTDTYEQVLNGHTGHTICDSLTEGNV